MNTAVSNEASNKVMNLEEQSGLSRSTLFFLIFTIFLNAIGITIIVPVTPFIVQQYLTNPNSLPMVVGWLMATYSLFQFLAAPGLGVLSDRFGRRPLTLICLLGSAVGYLIFGIGGALWVLFLGRIIDGITGGNFSILAAYIGDVSKPEERGKLFGQIGGTVGVGFIIGPVIGGFAAKLGYSAPLYLAAAILLANTLWGFFAMPESLAPQNRTTHVAVNDLNPFLQLHNIFAITRLRWLLVTGFLYAFPFAMITTELAVLSKDKLGWTPEAIGLTLLFVGCVDIVMQGFLSGKLIPIFGEVRLTIAGLICEAVSYFLIGAVAITPQPILMFAGIFLFAFGSGLLEPALNALTSNAAEASEQGIVQGGNQAMRSLANIAGPLLAGVLYTQYGGAVPYWLAAAIILTGIVTILLAAQNLSLHTPAAEAEPANG